jgi:glycerophosphoryl diester phosphodiesterase
VPEVRAVSERDGQLPPLKRVGHKGADHVEPGNTRKSFEAALTHDVDMIEFDVLRIHDGRLVLAHDLADAAGREPLTLEEGLDLFAGKAYADIELNVDLKIPGYEREVADGLAKRGLIERSVVSSTYPESLDRLGEIMPAIRRGWSVPRAKRDYTRSWLAPAVLALLRAWRVVLPRQAVRMIAAGRCEGVMAHYLLASSGLVREVHAADGFVYVWTVDDQRRIRQLEAFGVDGVITNDPRLFA